MVPKIDLIQLSDWIAIYKDDELVYENHSIYPQDLLNILDIDYTSREILDWNYDDALPQKLEDLNK
jgi:hypothetical protein